jgi:hypothetical protein
MSEQLLQSLSSVLLELPFSRRAETEADLIGVACVMRVCVMRARVCVVAVCDWSCVRAVPCACVCVCTGASPPRCPC